MNIRGRAVLALLAHTAMGLDIYAWLAQRLHRIDPRKPAFIAWAALKDQCGPDYERMDNFKCFFRKTLAQVQRRWAKPDALLLCGVCLAEHKQLQVMLAELREAA
jgi:hypothetical protein